MENSPTKGFPRKKHPFGKLRVCVYMIYIIIYTCYIYPLYFGQHIFPNKHYTWLAFQSFRAAANGTTFKQLIHCLAKNILKTNENKQLAPENSKKIPIPIGSIWVFPKNSGFSPQITHFNKVFHYKSSILGYHHLRKHPYMV